MQKEARTSFLYKKKSTTYNTGKMSAVAYKSTVIPGASGTMGKPLLDALLRDGRFNITVLDRKASLTSALQG
jgi:hypothetical protein